MNFDRARIRSPVRLPRSRRSALSLSRRGHGRPARHAARQSDLVVLLSQPRPGFARSLSLHRARSHRLRPVRQARRLAYDYTLRSRVDDLESAAGSSGHLRDNLTLVLHDWGGMIGMAFARRHPERDQATDHPQHGGVSICRRRSVCPCRCGGPQYAARPLLVRGFNAFCRGGPHRRAAQTAAAGGSRRAISLRTIRGAIASPCCGSCRTSRCAGRSRLRPRQRSRARACTASLIVPMLICWGEHDFVFDRHFLDEWQRRFPARKFIGSPTAGITFSKTRARDLPLMCDISCGVIRCR